MHPLFKSFIKKFYFTCLFIHSLFLMFIPMLPCLWMCHN